MEQKEPNKFKLTLIYLGWGLLAMVCTLILLIIAASIGWGI